MAKVEINIVGMSGTVAINGWQVPCVRSIRVECSAHHPPKAFLEIMAHELHASIDGAELVVLPGNQGVGDSPCVDESPSQPA